MARKLKSIGAMLLCFSFVSIAPSTTFASKGIHKAVHIEPFLKKHFVYLKVNEPRTQRMERLSSLRQRIADDYKDLIVEMKSQIPAILARTKRALELAN